MLSAGLGFAQSRNITGKVTDATTGEGIPFASIQVKGTMTGASADADGNYSINVKSNDAVLVFVSVGYKQHEVATDGKKNINVELNLDATAIDETIVVAYGTAHKKSFTGSVAVVKTRIWSAGTFPTSRRPLTAWHLVCRLLPEADSLVQDRLS